MTTFDQLHHSAKIFIVGIFVFGDLIASIPMAALVAVMIMVSAMQAGTMPWPK